MQNLTAHYNILYNANELLRQKQETYADSYIDRYTNVLSVYQDTIANNSSADKDLDAVMQRANTIINEKDQSHYIGDAYLVLAKANFLSGKFFDAVEYANYVIRSFPEDFKLGQQAAAWKVRALLYLKNQSQAKLALDSAFIIPNPKKQHITTDVYAAALQYDITARNYADAIENAKKAIATTGNTQQKLRWTFILGQLQELNHQNTEALANYTKVVKSNASFEMAFNANLNRIRIEDTRNGMKLNRTDLLLSLLKDENNIDFNDQIYYQVAEVYAANKDITNALKYYKLSTRSSLKNQDQKGLSYLRIADIDFSIKADYVNAKKYYDSTLTNLSPTYPGYQAIQKKSNNLQVLVDKLQIIAREDTLQALAKMDEPTRQKAIDAMVTAHTLQQQVVTNNTNTITTANNPVNNNIHTLTNKAATGSSFYFYNTTAVSQGYTDFKRKWGDRKLEDNWRRANNGIGVNTNDPALAPALSNIDDPLALPANMRKDKNSTAAGGFRQSILQDLPLTPALLEQSETRKYNAYLDIANFYRDILEDKKEAIANFELILNKYPNNPNKAQIYYSLYRLYSELDVAKSNDYKNRLLKEYPETVFAKVIIDPEYTKKLDDNEARFNDAYNQVYALYSQRKYTQVIGNVDSLVKQYPGNKLLVQLYYLRAISSGHLEKAAPFREELRQIAVAYPNDRLVTPLVKQHLAYVDANMTDLAAQTYAIMGTDTTGNLFSPPIENHKDAVFNRGRQFTAPVVQQPADVPVNKPVVANNPAVNNTPAVQSPAIAAPAKVVSTLFNEFDNTHYFFVVNVSTGTTDLSSSRFGIGQFNRANFQGKGFRHQLKNAGTDNQLIYVGNFTDLAAAKDYAKDIIPFMPQIMKVPKDKYSFFIITQENLNKLANKKLLDDYIEYYQQTLLNNDR